MQVIYMEIIIAIIKIKITIYIKKQSNKPLHYNLLMNIKKKEFSMGVDTI